LTDLTSEPVRKQKPGRLAGADFITAVLLALFGAGLLVGSLNMKTRAAYMFWISPGFFPMILGGLFIFFGLLQMYTSSRRGGCQDALRILSAANLKRGFTSPIFKKGGVVFLLILGYVSLLKTVDFVPLSMGYLFLTFLFLKAEKWYWLIVIAAAAPFIVQLVFNHLFRIPMP
jgi:hypothetical protein